MVTVGLQSVGNLASMIDFHAQLGARQDVGRSNVASHFGLLWVIQVSFEHRVCGVVSIQTGESHRHSSALFAECMAEDALDGEEAVLVVNKVVVLQTKP